MPQTCNTCNQQIKPRVASPGSSESAMPSLCRGLALEDKGVICLVGAGGKTSLMFRLARELSAAGQTVLTTTTTKIMRPEQDQSAHLILSPCPEAILDKAKRLLKQSAHLSAAARQTWDHAKLIGFAPEAIEVFLKSGLFRWIVVEADGSRRRPLKAPAPHEPVIPQCARLVTGVLGLDAFGKPLDRQSVFRPRRVSKITGLGAGMKIDGHTYCDLLTHRNGIFQGTPAGARQIAFLNQADLPGTAQAGRAVIERLVHRKSSRLSRVVLGSALSEPPVLAYGQLNRLDPFWS